MNRSLFDSHSSHISRHSPTPQDADPPAPPQPPNGGEASGTEASRPAAVTWIAATGTAMLFSALAVLTVVQWKTMSYPFKFAILLGATTLALISGIKLHQRFPVTAAALAHLGALLVPIDATALARSFAWHWPQLLVLQGVTGFAAIALLQRRVRTIVSDYTRPIAVGIAVAGIATINHLSAPTLAAVVALAITLGSRDRRAAMTLTIASAFSPIAVVLIASLMHNARLDFGHGVAHRVGILGAAPAWHIATALLTALTLGIWARRDTRIGLGAISGVAFVVNAMLAWNALPLHSSLRLLSIPATFLAVELIAFALRSDPLFARAMHRALMWIEVPAFYVTAAPAAIALALIHFHASTTLKVSAAFVAAAWIVSIGRSTDANDDTVFKHLRTVAFGCATFASIAMTAHTNLQVAATVMSLALATLVIARRHYLVALTAIVWTIYAAHATPWSAAIALIAIVITTVIAIREDAPRVLWFSAVSAVALETWGFRDLGLHPTQALWLMCTIAVVSTATSAMLHCAWRNPVYAIATSSAALSLTLAALRDHAQFGYVLMVLSIGMIALGVLRQSESLSNFGGALALYGLWSSLATRHMAVAELYLLPLGVYLLVVALVHRRAALCENPGAMMNSWVVAGPALAVWLIPSLVAGLNHGPKYHLLIAGSIAVLAVAVGGVRRFAAPLLMGTAALVVIVADATFGPATSAPAWFWLAVGGSALVATAIAMERTHTSPLVAGRRLVDVVNEQFS